MRIVAFRPDRLCREGEGVAGEKERKGKKKVDKAVLLSQELHQYQAGSWSKDRRRKGGKKGGGRVDAYPAYSIPEL